jgi:glutamate synthase (NADPH/NADH) small chain
MHGAESDGVYVGWGRKAIEIGRLQRFAMDNAQSPDLLPRAPRNGRSVGHVGGGPASLACAGTLALLGYDTVIYEKTSLPGGLNVSGVAPYKFQAEDALEEADFIRALGVEFRMNVEIGADISAAALLDQHDAVFIGVGLGSDSRRGVPGADGDGVIGALEWIESMKLAPGANVKDLRSVVVVGGGNTALDVAQEMAGLGVPQVRLVYRRGQQDMSGYVHEFEGAKKLRVQLVDCATVGAVARNAKGGIESVVLHKTINGQATDQVLDRFACDLVVVATGQERLQQLVQQFPGVICDGHGRVQADPETLVTGNPRVFTGGDCHNGGKEVVNAADEGQRAARAIHAMLQKRTVAS